MYRVEVKHYCEVYRKGDRESDWLLHDVLEFKRKKDAKDWILSKVPLNSHQDWRTGDNISRVYYSTNKTWFNEGTGETDEEVWLYLLKKI